MLHVAVLLKPYLDLILGGEKTIECRLTIQNRAPFEQIEPGERIFFKQSAGPYRAVATAEHVLCEGDLTPRRVSELRRDYNEFIRGEPAFWRLKRSSRYATLVWLRDVAPVDVGPAVRPLQGVAWLVLPDQPGWQAPPKDAGVNGDTFSIELTPGNLRNSTVYVTGVLDRFPKWAIGGRNRNEAARAVTLMLHDGPTVETDIVGPRKLFRVRRWGPWFRRHGARPGDRIVFTPVDAGTFFVSLARGR